MGFRFSGLTSRYARKHRKANTRPLPRNKVFPPAEKGISGRKGRTAAVLRLQSRNTVYYGKQQQGKNVGRECIPVVHIRQKVRYQQQDKQRQQQIPVRIPVYRPIAVKIICHHRQKRDRKITAAVPICPMKRSPVIW